MIIDAALPPSAPSSQDAHTVFFRLLSNFLQQLFENDLIPEDVDIRQSVAWLAALFAAPAAILSVMLILKYATLIYLIEQAPERVTELERATWGDELFFILYSMAAVGFLTVLVWEAAFPDQRDAQILGVLPVRARTVVCAKLAALVLFIGVFAFVINVPTAAGFALSVMGFRWLAGPSYLLVHMVVAPLAGLFVFVCLIALQTILTTLLHPRLVRGITITAQLLFVIALIEMFVYSPALSTWLAAQALVLADTGAGSWLPPLWFLGLYETLLGSDVASFHRLAGTAVAALGLGLATTATVYALGYGRLARRAIEGVQRTPSPPGVLSRTLLRVWVHVAPDRTGQAVTVFICKSLARSRRHRLILALFLGVALALILSGFIGQAPDGASVTVAYPTVRLLSIPLIFSFFAVVGLRVLFAVPIELAANWSFQMTEHDDKTGYLRGTRHALILIGLVPVALITLPAYWALWGPQAAIGHTVLWVLLGALLVEALLFGFSKVPFACSYVPEKANVKMLAPLYVAVMLVYGYSTARWELWLLAEAERWLVVTTGLLATLAVLAMLREKRRQGEADMPFLTYQETAPEAWVELGLRHARPRVRIGGTAPRHTDGAISAPRG